MRKKIVIGNWKMNKTVVESEKLAAELLPGLDGLTAGCDVGIAPTFLSLTAAGKGIAGSPVHLVAQNCHYENDGAYTGEVSATMLKEAGCSMVIVGHSERRQYFGETNATVNLRVKKALEEGLGVVLCVGETLEQRESGVTEVIISSQVREALFGIEEIDGIIIAYEPVWAIGTGRTATSQQAQEVHQHIRTLVGDLYSKEVAAGLRIQYGGSVKPSNAAELFAMPDIDGGLIGGASLVAADFIAIVKAAAGN